MVARGARYEAKLAGHKYYNKTVPCPKCGGVKVLTSSCVCVVCDVIRVKQRYANNIAGHRDAQRIRNREHREKNREHLAAYLRQWQKNNPGKVSHYTSKYRAAILQRTPLWADLDAILLFYQGCPPGHHVDHVVPLQGRNVSGLHVLNNLQYLIARDNLSKGNRF